MIEEAAQNLQTNENETKVKLMVLKNALKNLKFSGIKECAEVT